MLIIKQKHQNHHTVLEQKTACSETVLARCTIDFETENTIAKRNRAIPKRGNLMNAETQLAGKRGTLLHNGEIR